MQKPNTKVSVGAMAGGVAVVIVWILGFAVTVPAAIAVAITSIITFGAQYWIPNK